MYTARGFRNIFIITVILLSYSMLSAQVRIKERVEIKPSRIARDTIYNHIEKPFSKFNKIMESIDIITVPDSCYVTISVISSETAVNRIDVVLGSPLNQTILPNANNQGGIWHSGFINESTVLDVGILWRWYDGENSPETGDTIIKISDSTYTIGFEDVGWDMDYNDLVVQVDINRNPATPDHFVVQAVPDTVAPYMISWISALAVDKEGIEFPLDDNTNITMSIDQNAGVIDPMVPYGQLKNGNVHYSADFDPVCIQDVNITVSGFGASGNGKVVVKQPPCLVVSASNKEIRPGEKTGIMMQQMDCNGNLTDYPNDQEFSIWLNTDEKYGKLHCVSTGDEGPYVYGQQPFEFIASDSINVDSTVVEIEAWAFSGGASSIAKDDTLYKPAEIMLKKQKSDISKKTALIEKNKLRSLERLKKRLMVQGEKSGNKHRYAVIIESINKRYAEIIGIAKSVEVEQEKSGQVLMDMQEGASCELPVVQVTIKDECIQPPSVPRCNEPTTQVPSIVIKENSNPFAGENVQICNTNPDEFAFVKPSANQFITPYVIDICFNETNKSWQFNLPMIEINVITGICEAKLGQYQVISSIEQVGTISSKCCAWKDFTGLLDQYPIITRKSGYIILEAIIEHEQVHKSDFEKDVIQASSILSALKGFSPLCENYKNYEEAEKRIKEQIEKTLEYFANDAISYWLSRTYTNGVEDKAKTLKYEQETQRNPRVHNMIIKYRDKLGCVSLDCNCY